ncbi:RNA polymerase sigma factor SigF [Acaryochloris sp. 'Moss Beach']|uniref:RNA polymerase sigma factor SigF n=1 Tax=Acaryochloris TaxID=155977 RepID=UPI001BAE56C1|nr:MULTISPECIES: RNA polymerase sigma factor SigF [Acaryochloris]QUY44243.1 RNA polymerase sigma factor SigF [Acaryochloris marina S15]UJB68975.1 RNA polymerase sigma factor SigF [Acaryochloris sp. 'Moss Beach']
MAYQTSLQSQTMELLVAYRQKPSVKLRNRLVRLNMGLVRKVAHRLTHQCAEPYEDLEQCGFLGLITAIERFDPSQGYAFSSFAVPYIRGEILHFLRDRANTVRIPRRWQQLSRDAAKARQALTMELGRQPNDQEIADALKLSMQEWRSVKLATTNRVPLSLNARVSSGHSQSDSAMTLGDTLMDVHSQILQANQEDRIELQQALNQLEDRTRIMIESVFFQQLSRQEVAKRIGVSSVTVTRNMKKGIDKMIDLLQQQQPNALQAEH